MPELLEPSALFEHQKKKKQGDRFELIEIDENEMKNELHRSRANMSLGDILQVLRERISFFGVYNQVDKIDQSKLVIKKLKY